MLGPVPSETPMKILLPVDGSSTSTRAAEFLIKHWPPETAITLLHVDMPLRNSVARYLDAHMRAQFHQDNSRTALKPAARVLEKAGYAFDEHMLVGDAGSKIVQFAHKGRYDLIVMGSHGRSALKSLFLGSVAIKALSNSQVPVLVVR